MKSYHNSIRGEYLQNSQVLSSLVLNPPYKVDGFTTSPKIGLRLDAALLFRHAFNLMTSLTVFMAVSCLLILCISLPIQHQNNQLIQNAKTLTNNKLIHTVKIQEASSYSKLYTSAAAFSYKDAEEIIQIAQTANTNTTNTKKLISFNKYPSIQFSGF